MITHKSQITDLLSELSSSLDTSTTVYLIGGGAMMFLSTKESTKDLDLVVGTPEEFDTMSNAIRDIGFTTTRPGVGYERMNLSDVFERDGQLRIDLFNVPSTPR